MSTHRTCSRNGRASDLDGILTACRRAARGHATSRPSQRWREAGGKVVGHFQVYFPEEIAHAAGMLPFKVRGAPIEPTHADSRFGSYLCSILKTSLELALSKRRRARPVRHPPDLRRGAQPGRRLGPQFPVPVPDPVPAPERQLAPCRASYLRGEYDRLRDADRGRSPGAQVTDDDLRRSIAVFNENRALLRELYAIKRETPWLRAGATRPTCSWRSAG